MMNRCLGLRALLATCLLTAPMLGHAFKIDTHLWVGLQVINDLEDDGNITVMLKGSPVTLPVPANVKNAILLNRNAYLLGNIGPDAMPDVVVGQTLVHPGVPNAWKSNDWLSHVLAKSQGIAFATAFAYGYLGHASADTFAHTYVNQYAGDIFNLEDSLLVATRHIALESFISRYNPPFLGALGQNLGASWTLVQPDNGVANFVRDTLIYDGDAAEQNNNARTGKHLYAYRSYRNVIKSAADSPLWRNIDTTVLQIVAAYYLDIGLTRDEAGRIVDFLNNEAFPRVNEGIDRMQDYVNRLNAKFDRLDAARFAQINNVRQRIINLRAAIVDKLAQRVQAEGQLCSTVTQQACDNIGCCRAKVLGRCVLYDPVCYVACRTLETLVCPISEAAGQAAAELIRQIDADLAGLESDLHARLTELRDRSTSIKNNLLDLGQRLTDLAQIPNSNTSPVKAYLDNWVKDVDLAMTEYVKAATAMMINTMNPDPAASPLAPMQNWWDCYQLTLVGVPSPVGTGSCGFRGDLEAIWAGLQSIAQIVEDIGAIATIPGAPTPGEIRAEIDRLKNEAIQKIRDAAIDALIDLLPQEWQDLIGVLEKEDMTEERLRTYYTRPETVSSKALLMVGDVDQRVKAEMHLTTSNKFDPQRFPAVYNAVVLAKLALLDNAGLAALAQAAGVTVDSSGAPLFANTDNVVAHAFTSMDGNHQWMPVAPPRPDSNGAPYRPAGPGDGYPPFPLGYASAAGFVPWKAEARSALFRSLFIGPLSPGIESPSEIALPEVLRADYPYRPCSAYPFPSDENDKTCIAIKILPVILQLLLD